MEPLPRPVGGDRDRGPALLAMWWTEVSVCIIMVTMRIYSRYKMKNFGLDDWFIVAALVLFLASAIAETFNATNGGARHLYHLSPAEIEYNLRVIWIENPLGIMAQATAKMSVAFLILRLIGPKIFWRKWSLYLIIALTFIVGVLASIFTFVQCNPPRALWEGLSKVPGARCWNPDSQSDWAIFSGSYYTFTDFFLALLPITFLWNLNLNIRRKIAMSILLSLGVFAGICSAVKTSYLHELSARSDFTWNTYNLAASTGAELLLLIVCACIPTIKPMYDLAREHPRFSFSYFATKRYRSSSYQKHSDSSSQGQTPRINGPDKKSGASVKVTALSDAASDPWANGDQNALIGMGNISVQREWAVHHGRTNSGIAPNSSPLEGSTHSEAAKFRGDGIV